VLSTFKGTFITVGTFSAISNLMMLAPSLYMLQVYDRVLGSRNEITLLMLTLMIVGAYLFIGALELVRSLSWSALVPALTWSSTSACTLPRLNKI